MKVEKIIGLTPMQEGMLFHQIQQPESDTYFEQLRICFEGVLNIPALASAFNQLIARHESLRAAFIHQKQRRPRQVILSKRNLKINELDWRDKSKEVLEDDLKEFAAADVQAGFNLAKELLMRVSILRTGEHTYWMIWSHHHIIMDGWCIGLLVKELFRIYAAESKGESLMLPAVSPFSKYITWLKNQNHKAAEAFWKMQIGDFEQNSPALQLPVSNTGAKALTEFRLPEKLSAQMVEFARQNGVTFNSLVEAIWALQLMVYNRTEDVAFGVVVSGRPPALKGVEEMVGLFINTVPRRLKATSNTLFVDFLKQVQKLGVATGPHDFFPLSRSQSLSPLKQNLLESILVFENYPVDPETQAETIPGTELKVQKVEFEEKTQYGLTLIVLPGKELTLRFAFDPATYSEQSTAAMAHHFEVIARQLMERPQVRLSDLSLLDMPESTALLEQGVPSPVAFPQAALIHELFEAQATAHPERAALRFDGRTFSYSELNASANRLARRLLEESLPKNVLIGLHLKPSFEMLVAILAVLKAGHAYLPIDPNYPESRKEYLVEDSKLKLLIADSDREDFAADHEWLNYGELPLDAYSPENLSIELTPDALAYVIYTSGSTGKPKGAMITHQNVIRLFFNDAQLFDFSEKDTWTLFHSYCFDFSVWEMYGALLFGGRLVIVPKEVARDPEAFLHLLSKEKVSVLNQTPGYFYRLSEAALQAENADLSIRYIIFGGEKLAPGKLADWQQKYSQTRLINMYGITETTVHVTYKEIGPKEIQARVSNIGKPIPTLEVLILDESLRPVPAGVPGEICVSGLGLAKGYLNRPKLTAERFLLHPSTGLRLYRSGDLGKRLPNGEIVYIGRMDQQVKIRGFRIEPAEIEACLSSHEEVREVRVAPVKGPDGHNALCAWLSLRAEDTQGAVKDWLADQLPAHMIPGYWVNVPTIPLTSNGKTDWKSLPNPFAERSASHTQFVPPANEAEEKMCEIWKDILGIEQIGVTDNFFDLGGDSIRSIPLVQKSREAGFSVDIGRLFEYPTVRALLKALNKQAAQEQADAKVEAVDLEIAPFALLKQADRQLLPDGLVDAYPLTMLQAGMCFHSLYHPASQLYHDLGSFYLKATYNEAAFQKAVDQLTARHEILRTAFVMDGFSEPLQLVYPSIETPLSFRDWRQYSENEQDRLLAAFIQTESRNDFEMEKAPLFHLWVHRRGADRFSITIGCHHAILDGWSVASLFTELFQNYFALLNEKPLSNKLAAAPFRKYVALENAAQKSAVQKEFWSQFLKDAAINRLPQLPARYLGQKGALGIEKLQVSAERSKELQQISKQLSIPFKSVLMSVHLKALSVFTGQKDVLTGIVTNGRPEGKASEQTLGLFLNALPFRQKMDQGNWAELIQATFEIEKEMLQHRRYPLAKIQQDLDINPLFDTLFNFTHFHTYQKIRGVEELEVLDSTGFEQNNFGLVSSFDMDAVENTINVQLHYDAGLLSAGQMRTLAGIYNAVMAQMCSDLQAPHAAVGLLPETALDEVLEHFNPAFEPLVETTSLQALMARNAQANPNKIALVFHDQKVTYAELNARANQLADYWQTAMNLRAGDKLVLCMHSSLELPLALWAAFKCRAAVALLDPVLPKARRSFIASNTEARFVVHNLPVYDLDAKGFELHWKDIRLDACSTENPKDAGQLQDVAFLQYTSGSQGNPKGVLLSHENLLNLNTWFADHFSFGPHDVLPQKTTISFGDTLVELTMPLTTGQSTVYLRPEDGIAKDFEELGRWLKEIEATIVQFVPSVFAAMLEQLPKDTFHSLKALILSGEALKTHYQFDFPVFNIYGNSECTALSTYFELFSNSPEIYIGKPLRNTRIYILDADKNPVPMSQTGEIFISGSSVGLGYWREEALTEEKFLDDCFIPSAKMFRTGDIGRWLPDGNIQYIGRSDQQVKIRGIRIELSEVEHALLKHPMIDEAVVLVRDNGGEAALYAYLVGQDELTVKLVRTHLEALLPDYMHPVRYHRLEALPLNSNGKINRLALGTMTAELLASGRKYIAPQTPEEKQMAAIWSDVLQVEKVGMSDNFFELGGHSLNATQMMARIQRQMGSKVTLQDLFAQPRIQDLLLRMAQRENRALEAIPRIAKADLYPLSHAQKRMWVLDQIDEDKIAYNIPRAVRLKGVFELQALQTALHNLSLRHESLRTVFVSEQGEPKQKIYEKPLTQLVQKDVSRAVDPLQAAFDYVYKDATTSFDLEKGPLLRVALLKVFENDHVLMLNMHHIISDGWSMQVLVKDLMHFYNAAIDGQVSEQSELVLQYKDYAGWHNELLDSDTFGTARSFWHEQFQGSIPALQLPADFPRPAIAGSEGHTLNFSFDKEVTAQLEKLCRSEQVSTYMALLTIVHVLLHKYSGQDDIITGSPVAGRMHPDLESQIGLYINTIAIRQSIHPLEHFTDLLSKVRQTVTKALDYQTYPFDKLVTELDLARDLSRNPLFDVMVILQNNPKEALDLSGLKAERFFTDAPISNFDLTFSFVQVEESLHLALEYNTALFKKDRMERVFKHLETLMKQVLTEPESRISDLSMTSPEEAKLLRQFNDNIREYNLDRTVHACFEAVVAAQPAKVALQIGDRKLTYGALNGLANRMAHYLREEYALQAEDRVALMLGRNEWMIASVLAVWKAGAAFVPIDPSYPDSRIQYMLEDSDAKLLLTEAFCQPVTDRTLVLVEDTLSKNTSNLSPHAGPNNLAYQIYTSGSTGRPKGVMVEHHSLVNLAMGLRESYALPEMDVCLLQMASFSFDVFVGDILRALLNGGKMVICPEDVRLDPLALSSLIKEHEVNIFEATPGLIVPLMDFVYENNIPFDCLKLLILGSDTCSPQAFNRLQSRFGDQMRIVNSYGVTEATIDSGFYEPDLNSDDTLSLLVPVGKPLANIRYYVLDGQQRLAPIGIPGELYIAGAGVARGYAGRESLTAARFLVDPFYPDTIMYRTGDHARWRSDGELEFLGRLDNQVKVRGYRIELGEVEVALAGLDDVQDAVVWTVEEGENKYLCGWYLAESTLAESDLQQALTKLLPAFMIPSRFVHVDAFPLSVNGKLDRKALPKPEMQSRSEFHEADNEKEQILVDLWQNILGVERVSTTDNWFFLGGDSIKAIQLTAKLYQYQLKLDIRDLFRQPTIRALSSLLTTQNLQIAQGTVVGALPLTPIQHTFFHLNHQQRHHYNQSVMLLRKDGFDAERVEACWMRLLEQHDALRMRFEYKDQNWTQYNEGLAGQHMSLKTFDIGGANEAIEIPKLAESIQASLSLENGPLSALAIFHTENGDHLLIAVHHLVVDGVSWRILLEDFNSLYESQEVISEVELPAKTHSFQHWARGLENYAQSTKLAREIPYWQKQVELPVAQLKSTAQPKTNFQEDARELSFELSRETTAALLRETQQAYNTEINDLLLTALALALQARTGEYSFRICLEGHGREAVLEDVDISRTVGWFTSEFPFVLSLKKGEDISHHIRSIKEALRAVPKKGIGYGILKYMRKAFTKDVHPQILFNYLGQFDEDLQEGAIQMSPCEHGPSSGAQTDREYALNINGLVLQGQLKVVLDYHREAFAPAYLEAFMGRFEEYLLALIAHCRQLKTTRFTPADFGDTDLSLEELAMIQAESSTAIEKIFPLTPMQEGMLFHTLFDGSGQAYFQQFTLDISGQLNPKSLEAAFNQVIDRYDILRTAFFHRGLRKSRQVVYKSRPIELEVKDLRSLDAAAQQTALEAEKQRDTDRGFNLKTDALMRVILLQTADESWQLIWSHHHILMDGWCMGTIIEEIFLSYKSFKSNATAELAPVLQFDRYVDWLQEWDETEAKNYWKRSLSDFEEKTGIQGLHTLSSASDFVQGEYIKYLDANLSRALSALAQEQGVTLNHVVQAIWTVILQRHNRREDVVFGAVVSGRPPELQGSSDMVGLFINTIPIRVQADGQTSFSGLLTQLRERYAEASQNGYLPLSEIQSYSPLKHDLVDHILVFENFPVDPGQERDTADELGFQVNGADFYGRNNYDLALVVVPGEQLALRFVFNKSIYADGQIESLGLQFKHLAHTMVASAEQKLSEVGLLPADQQKEILARFDFSQLAFPKEDTITSVFDRMVKAHPAKEAVVNGRNRLTYRQLDQTSNQVANCLMAKGIQAGDHVAISLERSTNFVAAILGVLKVGATYVPIDPSYPSDRKQMMMQDATVKGLIVDGYESLVDVGQNGHTPQLVDLGSSEFDSASMAPVAKSASPDTVAYMIYTSGSTGRPKGVRITHRNVVRLLFNEEVLFDFSEKDTWTAFHSFSFDFSVWELFGALLYGGKLVIVPTAVAKDPVAYVTLLQEEQVSVLNSTPGYFYSLMSASLKVDLSKFHLRYVIFGGEALSPTKLTNWQAAFPSVEMINMYGITETTVHVTFKKIGAAEMTSGRSNIGGPIPTLSVLVMDQYMQLLPIGVAGELCVGGEGLAVDYWQREALTAEKFVAHPFKDNKKIYRSGDLGRYLPGADLEYLGRIDQQVKIRGFRIELGEIQNQIEAHPAVDQALVMAKEGAEAERYLIGWYCLKPAAMEVDLGAWLQERLPEYMLPSHLLEIDQFQLNHNGKIDRKALPMPGMQQLQNTYVAARDEMERGLVKIWQDVLDLERIGVQDNFFELGGNSIRAIRIINQIQDWLDEIVHVAAIFESPTIEGLATRLRHTEAKQRSEVDAEAIRTFRSLIPPVDASTDKVGANPRCIFVLSPPRSGSTLLRVILAGHPILFAPPELELLSFGDMAERAEVLSGSQSFFSEGLLRAIMEIENCDGDAAKAIVEEMVEKRVSATEMYQWLQDRLKGRLLVDKSPNYALDRATLERAEAAFDAPFFIHLTRNPFGMIRSFEEAKMEQIFRHDNDFSRRELAELSWAVSHDNIQNFLQNIPADRQFELRYEDMVQEPEATIAALCEAIGIDFKPEMLEVYKQGETRMTDGVHEESRMIGDVKFHRHQKINSAAASRWKSYFKHNFLSEFSLKLAAELGHLEAIDFGRLAITAVDKANDYPLSNAQKRLWVLQELGEAGAAFNIPSAFRMEGPLQVEAFEVALQKLAARHEILRTVFRTVDGLPRQMILPIESFEFVQESEDLQSEDQPLESALARIHAVANEAFDLAEGPLLHSKIYKIGPDTHIFYFNIHHILADGWSMKVIVNDLQQLYVAAQKGEEAVLPELSIQYKDFASWQQKMLEVSEGKEARDYWLNQLSGNIPVATFPEDHSRPPIQTYKGAHYEFRIGGQLVKDMQAFCRANNTSLFVGLNAIVKVLLHRYTGQTDIIIGSPIAGREQSVLESQIGLYTNMLGLRDQIRPKESFRQFLAAVSRNSSQAQRYQHYPFDRLVEDLDLQRDLSRTPLFQVVLALQDSEQKSGGFSGLTIEPVSSGGNSSLFDLSFYVAEHKGHFRFDLEYNPDLYLPETIQRLATHFEALMHNAIHQADLPIAQLELLREEERYHLLHKFNPVNTDYPLDEPIHCLFEKIQADQPTAVAVVFGQEQMSYKALNAFANQIAHAMMDKGLQKGQIVNLALSTGFHLIAAALGAFKAGAGITLVDPVLPEARQAFILKDTGNHFLLSETNTAEANNGRFLHLNAGMRSLEGWSDRNPDLTITVDSPAVVQYSSGSTGQPKGVILNHRNMVNVMAWFADYFSVGAADVIPQKTTISFADAQMEMLLPLTFTGGAVYLRPYDGINQDYPEMVDWMKNIKATILQFVPSVFDNLMRFADIHSVPSVRALILSGEALSRVYELPFPVYNLYGNSECAIFSTVWKMPPAASTIFIGRPIENSRTYILDEYNNPVPIGVTGEIYTGGISVGDGYLNLPELTAEKFKDDPFLDGARMYKTGDLARWSADGNIEYLGRQDFQVKIRGVRIELQEVAHALQELSAVDEAFVIDMKDEEGHKYLCAYIISKQQWSVEDLRSEIGEWLPAYMIPDRFAAIHEIPLTLNGKIDRSKLPDPLKTEARTHIEFVPARNEMDEKLIAIWEKLLGLSGIGIRTHFFEAGGNSLKVMALSAELERLTGRRMRLAEIFKRPRLEDMSDYVAGSEETHSGLEIMRLSEGGSENIFCFPPIIGDALIFMEVAKRLTDKTVFGINYVETDNVIQQAADLVESEQRQGTLSLMGYSAGGGFAFSVACELERRGRKIERLVLIDSAARQEAHFPSDEEAMAYAQQMKQQFSAFFSQSNADAEWMERQLKRIESYYRFSCANVHQGQIDAPIDLLKSTDVPDAVAERMKHWAHSTQQTYQTHRGYGRHEEMLYPGFAEQNIQLIRRILNGELVYSTYWNDSEEKVSSETVYPK